ncbi:MAG: prohibitin family protein [Cetobacterium sp.]
MKKLYITGVIVLASIIGAGVAIKSIAIVPAGYVGVVYSMNGGVKEEVLTQGVRLKKITEKVTNYSIATETLSLSADSKEGSKDNESFDVVCRDGRMNVDLEMSYSFDPDKVSALFTRYRGLSGQTVMDTVIRGKIKTIANEVTSQYSVLEAHMEQKGEVNRALTELLRERLSEFGVSVESATLSQTRVDAAIEAAITERSKASQELEAEKQRQEKATLEAETKRIAAEGEKAAQIIAAQGEKEANDLLKSSISQELIDMKNAEARMTHGWITVQGGTPIVNATGTEN